MKKTHVELWAFGAGGKLVATGLVTPAGVCCSYEKIFPCSYGNSPGFMKELREGSFGYGVTDYNERAWKERAKRYYRAVRFQRVLVDF